MLTGVDPHGVVYIMVRREKTIVMYGQLISLYTRPCMAMSTRIRIDSYNFLVAPTTLSAEKNEESNGFPPPTFENCPCAQVDYKQGQRNEASIAGNGGQDSSLLSGE